MSENYVPTNRPQYNQFDKLYFTHVDNFCLLFFGAWLSTQHYLWHDRTLDLALIILGLVCVVVFLHGLRALFSDEGFTRAFVLLLLFSFLGALILFGVTIFKYYITNDEHYKYAHRVFIAVGGIWLFLSLIEFKINQHIKGGVNSEPIAG